MIDGIDSGQDREWQTLYTRISETLDQFGRKDAFGNGDYWLIDDNWGARRHLLEIQNLDLLKPHVVKSLQSLLNDYPDWEISAGVDVIKDNRNWPGMGLIIYSDEIIDKLERDYLPAEFRDLRYEGSRRVANVRWT